MRIFPQLGERHDTLIADDGVRADYIYMYPPRQAYRPVVEDIEYLIEKSLNSQNRLNIYLHYPFCAQICAYCNLFAVGGANDRLFERYTDALTREIEFRAGLIEGKEAATVYIGGGTPSLLPAPVLARVLHKLEQTVNFSLREVPEVSMEVAPESVDREKLEGFRAIGVNRVNLGLQTASAVEMLGIGRRYDVAQGIRSIRDAVDVGFSNVCVDLIYGLQGQTDDEWRRSLQVVIDCEPQTICTYALTLRPRTGYAAHGYEQVSTEDLYRRYDIAVGQLAAAGYRQENHVRFVKGGGGYQQKVNHWRGQNILGFGAGARSYLAEIDLRNGYSSKTRKKVLEDYMERVASGLSPVTDGIVMTSDEKRRKRIILGLFDFDRSAFAEEFGVDAMQPFGSILAALEREGLVEISPARIRLTKRGARHRDTVVQLFFSPEVTARVRQYDYELQ